MQSFNYYHRIQLRYSDIDAQGHVNNAKYVTFIETARLGYITELKLWNGESFLDLGLIVADTHISYLEPIKLQQCIRIGTKVSRIGNKSMTFAYQIEDETDGRVMAIAETVMVCYDYHTNSTVPVSNDWRKKIALFEGENYQPSKPEMVSSAM
jgi:acyl-CoA thioester hydrolase